MLAQHQACWTAACNDNGSITPTGWNAIGLRAAILRVVSALGVPVSVSYVADGVLLITSAKQSLPAA